MKSRSQILIRSSLQIEYFTWGSGDPIVLLPGLGGGDADQFFDFAALLSQRGYTVICPNPRGAGQSKGPLTHLTLHDLARDVAGVVEHNGFQQAHMLGRAFGNRLARCVAADFPEMTRSLILLAAGGLVPPDEEARLAFDRLFRIDLSESERTHAARISLFSPSTVNIHIPNWKSWPDVVKSQVEALKATPTKDWWFGGTSPMLVLQGMDDRIAPPANGHALKDKMPDRVEVMDIPHAGHALLFEQPMQVIEAIISFLKNLES